MKNFLEGGELDLLWHFTKNQPFLLNLSWYRSKGIFPFAKRTQGRRKRRKTYVSNVPLLNSLGSQAQNRIMSRVREGSLVNGAQNKMTDDPICTNNAIRIKQCSAFNAFTSGCWNKLNYVPFCNKSQHMIYYSLKSVKQLMFIKMRNS